MFRSIPYQDALLLGNGQLYKIDLCQDENFKYLLQRLSQDIVCIMRELKINRIELACLKAILLFDPDAKSLQQVEHVTQVRDQVCLALSQYCKYNHPHDPSRFAKLLMRLPSMRSWSLKGIENILFARTANEFDDTIVNMIVNKSI